MQKVQKSKYYMDRYLGGELESELSNQRIVATENISFKLKEKNREVGLNECLGHRVTVL